MDNNVFNAEMLVEYLNRQLSNFTEMLEQSKNNDRYVIVSEKHVFVGKDNGLNGTGFNVRGVFYNEYPKFDTYEDAVRNVDHYLIDMQYKPIFNFPIKESQFYIEEIESIRHSISTIQSFVESNGKDICSI